MTKATRAKNIFVSNRIESNRIVSIVHVAAFPRDLTLYTFSGLGCRRTFALRCTVNSRRLRRGICDNRFVRKRFVYRTRFNKLVLSREIFKTTRRARRWYWIRQTLKKNSNFSRFPLSPLKLINFLGATSDRRWERRTFIRSVRSARHSPVKFVGD